MAPAPMVEKAGVTPNMKPLQKIRAFFRREKLDHEMADEIRAHIELRTQRNLEAGMSPEEARYAAMRAFGGVEQIKERCRDERRRGWIWLEQFSQDLRHAIRSLRRNPGFATAIVLTLALGIGGNATIFSVVNAVVLEPLPYAQIDRVVNLRETRPVAGGAGKRVPVPVSPATYFDWRNEVRSLEQIAAVAPNEFTLTGRDEPEQLAGAEVTANLFPLLGVVPILGRNFLPEENRPGADAVLLSHAFWQRKYAAATTAIGQAITLDGRRYTIVGVLPAWFDGAAAAGIARGVRAEIWSPLALVEAGAPRSVPAFDVHARLKPGATIANVRAEVDAVMQRLAKEFPQTNAARGAQVEPIVDRVLGDTRSSLWVVFAAVGVVLLIACANVANLLLARATLRGPETAVRAALGASRSRLMRQFLTESLLLALAGCALGLTATLVSIDAFVSLLPSNLPRAENIAVDARVLLFTVGVSLFTGVAFGLLPAWHGAKTDLQSTIKTGGRSGVRTRARSTLVVAQVSLSLVLLVAAGLLLQSFAAVNRVELGFDPRNVLTLRVNLSGEKYRGSAPRISFFQNLLRETETLPGVESAAMVFPLPFSRPIVNRPFAVPGRPVDPSLELSTQYDIVSPEFFRALGIRITQGRGFTERDRADSPLVITVSETLARRIWPDENPIGKRISVGLGRLAEREVVGVFADFKQRELESEPRIQVCVPFAQEPMRSMYLAVRGRVAATVLLPLLRERIAALDRDLPYTDLAMWHERVADSIAVRRITTWLLAAFSGTALLLAVLGLYGVMSYSVAQRTREFGVRVALGAKVRDLLQLVVSQGMKLVVVGLVVGVVGSLALTRVLSGFLFGVQPTDPGTFAVVSALLVLVGALACWLPARRATKVDPVVALRAE
jgi:putative ABC transport system permease protein